MLPLILGGVRLTCGLGGEGLLGVRGPRRRPLAWTPRGRRRHKGMVHGRRGSSRWEFTRWGTKNKLRLHKIKTSTWAKLDLPSSAKQKWTSTSVCQKSDRRRERLEGRVASSGVLRPKWRETYIVIPKCFVVIHLREVADTDK